MSESAKRLADAIARHSGYTVVIHNSGRYVFLWHPLNYTLPNVAVFSIYQTNLAGLPGLNSQNIGIIYACSQVA